MSIVVKKKHLLKKGWRRDKTADGIGEKYYEFHHRIHGEYQLYISKEGWLLSDDSDELDVGYSPLTKKRLKEIHKTVIDVGMKSY